MKRHHPPNSCGPGRPAWQGNPPRRLPALPSGMFEHPGPGPVRRLVERAAGVGPAGPEPSGEPEEKDDGDTRTYRGGRQREGAGNDGAQCNEAPPGHPSHGGRHTADNAGAHDVARGWQGGSRSRRGSGFGRQIGGYAQMYSSAIAPSCHFATVTMRLPSANSPMTQVHSPDPKAMGCAVI